MSKYYTKHLVKGDIITLKKDLFKVVKEAEAYVQPDIIKKLSGQQVIFQQTMLGRFNTTYSILVRPLYKGSDEIIPITAIDLRIPLKRGQCVFYLHKQKEHPNPEESLL